MQKAALARREITDPAYFSAPRVVWTSGPAVAEVCAAANFAPDPEQERALDVIFAEDETGRPLVFDFTLIAPRQNIKTGLAKLCTAGWLFVTDERKVIYSAHQWNPAVKDMFEGMRDWIVDTPAFSKRTKHIYSNNGDESIVLRNRAQMLFKTRTTSPIRGLTAADKLIVDEAFAAQPSQVGGALPTLATRRNAQVLWLSSGCHTTSIVLRDIVDTGRAGGAPRSAYMEFCAPPPAVICDRGEHCDHGRTVPGCGFDKPEFIAMANTQYGKRISPDFFVELRRLMTPREYGREVMGYHDALLVADEGSPFDMDAWDDLTDDDRAHAPADMSFFGIEVDPERAWTSIGAAGRREDDRVQLDLVTRGRGTNWVIGECNDLNDNHGPATFGIVGNGPAKDLIPKLERAGLNVVTLSAADESAADGALVDAVNKDRSVAHGPDDYLHDAAEGARKRVHSDGVFTLGRLRSSTVDVTPMKAVSIAKWLLEELDYDVADSVL